MMPPRQILERLKKADFIVQVKVESVNPSSSSPGKSVITARVLKQFKGDIDLKAGETIEISLTTYSKASNPPPGGPYTYVETLKTEILLEVYLSSEGPGRFHASNNMVISQLSDRPVYLPSFEQSSQLRTESCSGVWSKIKKFLSP